MDRPWQYHEKTANQFEYDIGQAEVNVGGRFICSDHESEDAMWDALKGLGYSLCDHGQCEVLANKRIVPGQEV